MQGKVLDGQYLNEPFMTGMDNPLLNQLDDGSICKDAFWWPTQWDLAHWLDKVFGKFKEKPLVDRLLKRTALYHQLFRFGKMHSVAAATSKDLKLPAHQQFMSSSYPSLKKAWRCTSRHSNIMTTVLTCATNFMVKTLFLIYWVFLTCFGLWWC